ncbi:nuclear factor of activated T-cells, cytoplasmic 2-like [Melanotaenia boesemani]|uniref:nuclear factor of activated T-cells, cytoplasmic 2-like n=1 Tax=Melanotaenia boesemani TaxID=1250792 RepID=UPI001C042A55|nr:nuclear factor of activated T-cells, cytoplasmic 2-like [Melanotaenia boesemani]
MTSGGLGLNEDLGQDISQEELDFSDLFLYNPPNEDFAVGCDKDDPGALLQNDSQPPLLVVDHHTSYISTSTQAESSQDTSSHSPSTENLSGAVFDSLGLTRANNIPAPSPRIEITPSGDSLSSQNLEPSPSSKALGAYRECVSPASSNSSTGWPAEAISPLNSPCVSPPNGGSYGISLPALDLCPGLQGIHTSSVHSSPGASPHNSITDETFLQPHHQCSTSPLPHQRSRSTSPQGKRSFDQAHPCQGGTPVKQRSRSPSPIPSPHEQQRPYYLPHQYQPQAEFQPQAHTSVLGLEDMLNSLSSNLPRPVPNTVMRSSHAQPQRQDCAYGEGYDWGIEQDRMSRAGAEIKSESFYMLQASHVWPPTQSYQHAPRAAYSGLALAPLPSLEWSLPSHSGPYELLIQQQPRSHHRAHYETEGSRGAVKTPNGGHPEVQLLGYQGTAPLGLQVFIGTSDERLLKPHAFYQVHRITGKTVTTPSMERMINGTKVLEIPLEPKNHMRVMIDCVGILKLRNADIELRNGETDIGRKNTRVRLVFRVHVPQPEGQLVSLQVASNPIECSQRSAQELPAVERQDLDRCSVLGGQQMVLTGQNFTSDSKVIFSEKTQDGKQIWEVEATVDRDKTQANMLFVEVPPYRDRSICQLAKVNFYVINGKKKCSQPQHFIYTPLIAIKAEPLDDYQLNSYGHTDNQSLSGMSVKSLYHHLEQNNSSQALNVSSTLYHLTTVDPRAHMLTSGSLDEPAYYQSRAGTLINSPVMYHTANQRYSNCSTALLSHPASTPSQCISARTPVAKRAEAPQVGDSFEACLVSRHQALVQTSLPLGKSPPSRYSQEKAGNRVQPVGQALNQIGSARGNHDDQVPERIMVKQENLSYAYLEDVNDIIRRDMRGHNGD